MKVYDNSPIRIQNFLMRLESYRLNKKRYGSVYSDYLTELENKDYTDLKRARENQQQEMKKLIAHAVSNSKFYREFYKHVDLESIQTINDLKKLPVLEKETVRERSQDIYTVPEEHAIPSNTSGTSGIPLRVLYTKEDVQKRMAHLDFFKKQHGVTHLEMKRASFSGTHFIPKRQKARVYWRDNKGIKQRLYSSYYCHEDTARDFAENLNIYKPDFLDGIPSAIYQVAKWINANNYPLTYQPIAIFATGETVYPYYRQEIEKAFGCPMRNQYSSSEGAPFIAECTNGKLHYNLDTGIIEITEKKEMLVTCFNTYGTPLIRYNIGDWVEMETETAGQVCGCGSAYPIVKEIHGRTSDYLISKSGRKFTAYFMSIVNEKFVNKIQKMQFIQKERDTIIALLEVGENAGEIEDAVAAVKDELVYMLGEDIKIDLQIVRKIPVNDNGKYRLVINELTKDGVTV